MSIMLSDKVNCYVPRNYATMTEREREVARIYFNAGRTRSYPNIAKGIGEETIAVNAWEAGREYEASLA